MRRRPRQTATRQPNPKIKTMRTKEERQNFQNEIDRNDPASPSRRGFLKAGATLGTAMCLPLAASSALAAQGAHPGQAAATSATITKRRTLGSGATGMDVSAL